MYRTLGLVLLIVCSMAGLGACSTENVKDSPASGDDGVAPAASKAGVGDALELNGNDSKLKVTLVKTKRLPAESSYGIEMHPALYGVQFTVKNSGEAVYDDSISNCVTVVDSKDQSHSPEIAVSGADGDLLPGTLESVKIAPGDKRTGWVYFAMGKKIKPRMLQFTPESGFGTDVGQWKIK